MVARKTLRLVSLLVLLLLAVAPAGLCEPREEFFAIDEPLFVGGEILTGRLDRLRRDGPLAALHLSGGSARAFCHLGVLERLEEQGVYPDLIVTNSMGSIIGLLYAAGVPLEVMADIFRTLEYSELFTLKIPVAGGLMDMRGLLAVLRELVGEVDVAELPIPVAVVCEDLRSMRRTVLCRGDLLTVMQAAIALPVWFDPIKMDDMVLLDGGFTNLTPLEPFIDLAEAHILSTAFYDRELKSLDPLTVLNRGINIAKSRSAVEDIETWEPFLIRNDVESFDYMGWEQLGDIVREGYDSCDRRIEALGEYLRDRGISAGERPSRTARLREEHAGRYEQRWAQIKKRLSAGRPLPLPGGFSALQVRPILLRQYRGESALEQSNYLALSYLYQAQYSAVELGALTDFAGTWGALTHLSTAVGGSLLLGLDNYALFAFDGGAYTGMRTHHRFHAKLPVLLGERIVTGPFFSGELRLSVPATPEAALDHELLLAAGVDFRLSSLSGTDFLQERPAYLFEAPALHGFSNELMFRKSLFGPLHLFSRALLKATWPVPGQPGVALRYNDFFRGLERDAPVASFAVFNGELLLAPRSLSLSLWETLLLQGFELAAFCDLYWPEAASLGGPAEPSVGASLKGEAALMGLLSMTVVLSGGYDFGVGRPFFTLNLGSVY